MREELTMKRTNKLILSLALGATVAATFGTAFALYQNGFENNSKEIEIGTVQGYVENNKTINYSIGEVTTYKPTSDNAWVEWGTDDKITPDLNKVKVVAPLSFSYNTDDKFKGTEQPYTLGRLQVTVELKNANLAEGTKVSAKLTGYTKPTKTGSTDEYDNYFTANKMSNFLGSKNADGETANAGSSSITGFIDTAIDKSNIKCEIELDFSTSTADAGKFLSIAEATNLYSISLTWGGYKDTYSDFDAKLKPTTYIRSDVTNWEAQNDFALVPNINGGNGGDAKDIEWMYTGLTNTSQMKIYDSSDEKWFKATEKGDDITDSDDGNVVLDKDSKYNAYFIRYRNDDGTYKADTDYKFYIGKAN